MARLIGFALLVTGFWYLFYHSQSWPAFGLLLGASWLAVREGLQLLMSRRNPLGGSRRRRLDRPDHFDPVV